MGQTSNRELKERLPRTEDALCKPNGNHTSKPSNRYEKKTQKRI